MKVANIGNYDIKDVHELKVIMNSEYLVSVSSNDVFKHTEIPTIQSDSDCTNASRSFRWEEFLSDMNRVAAKVGSPITEENDFVGILTPRTELMDAESETGTDESTRSTSEFGMLDLEEELVSIIGKGTNANITKAILHSSNSYLCVLGDDSCDELNEMLLGGIVLS